jgi:molybdate transport system substrate-binding protein
MSEAAEPVLLHAAGSLRVSLDEVGAAYEKATGVRVIAKYGASGLLREEIERGTKAEVFASANMEHPLMLARAGKSSPVALFARNQLCALVRPDLAVTPANLLDRMMEAQVKLGTSTPRADPSGDYAWEVFRKADAQRPGAFAALSHKALQLTGSPTSASAPAGRSLYGMLVSQGRADIFLTYCTNALEAVRENPGQRAVTLPDNLAVGADYGLTVMSTASPAAYRFALFILSGDGQRILANHGFAAPGVPR